MISTTNLQKTIVDNNPFSHHVDKEIVSQVMHDYYLKLGWCYHDRQKIWTRTIHATMHYDLKLTAYGNAPGFQENTIIILQVSTVDGEIIANSPTPIYPKNFESEIEDWIEFAKDLEKDVTVTIN